MRSVQRPRPGSPAPAARRLAFIHRALLLGLLPLLGATAGCQDDPLDPAAPPPAPAPAGDLPLPESEAPAFLAIRKDLPGQAADSSLVRQMLSSAPADVFEPGDSFYLAVHRRELGKRWFLSAYLKEFFPDEVAAGAAKSLGTRVVSFRVQNGKLYVFDVDDRKQTSDSFGGDDTLVDAYPIVDPRIALSAGAPVRALRDYLLVDPGAGLNRFGVVADGFASGTLGAEKPFQVELKFSQRFRALADGVTFEQAFTGYSERPRPRDPSVPVFQERGERLEPNLFRSSGVLGLALRRYQEGEGFSTIEVPFSSQFFTGRPRLVPNQGRQALPAAKWNIGPDLPPVEWLISPLVEKYTALPETQAAGVDMMAAIKRGIESWNSAFGFTALTARVARPDESLADDDKNYLVYEENDNVGYAFANYRANPNTGEIRGASVYFNDAFRKGALQFLRPRGAPPAPVETPAGPAPARRPAPRPSLTWQPFPGQRLCGLHAAASLSSAMQLLETTPSESSPERYKENVEKFIAQVVAHEIGHTLGLRHNFKGSLLPPSSSVMDYTDGLLRVESDMPGSYDVDAIRYLYGLSSEPPGQPFCNDDGVGVDPTCRDFDRGADPLREFYGRYYPLLVRAYLQEGDLDSGYAAVDLLVPLIDYLRLGRTLPDRIFAFQSMVGEFTATAPPVAGRPPTFAPGANDFAQVVMFFLFPDPALPEDQRPPVGPPLHAQIEALLATELSANLLNQDGLRNFTTRRQAVDTLKRMQSLSGYQALRTARTVLATPSDVPPSPSQQALLEDLRARIDSATSPYFD